MLKRMKAVILVVMTGGKIQIHRLSCVLAPFLETGFLRKRLLSMAYGHWNTVDNNYSILFGKMLCQIDAMMKELLITTSGSTER